MDRNIESFVTEKGSIYYQLEDGRIRRFKTATNETQNPQDMIVFIPDYDTLKRICPTGQIDNFGENEDQYNERLLEYVHTPGAKIRVCDGNATRIEGTSSLESANENDVYLAFGDALTVDFFLKVSKDPQIGFKPFDTRGFIDEKGNYRREKHIGHKVTKIKRRAA